MFTWICPQCGREVLPSYDQCPSCHPKGSDPAAPSPVAEAPQPPVPSQQPASVAAAPPPPASGLVYQQPVATQPIVVPRLPAPEPAGGLPTWLLTVLFAFAFLGLGSGLYWGVGYLRNPSTAAAPPPTVESPAAKPAAKTSPLQKYVEISGVRWTEDAKKHIVVKFTVTNHSDADLAGLAGNVTIWGRTQKSEEDAVGTFSFGANVGPQASQEVSAILNTKLKIYELPDWQNVNADLQITAPQ